MNIERQSFIPAIQEKKRVFEKRLRIFPEGFVVLADSSDEVILKNKTALVCGYLCSELWDFLPQKRENQENLPEREVAKSEKILKKRFSLGHNPAYTHKTNGQYLYVSSFALLKEYRGKGLGEKFFINAVAALCAAQTQVKKVVILVNSDWEAALRIYKKLGFQELYTFKNFFPTIQKKVASDGIVMCANAHSFREIQFTGSEEAIKI